MEKGRSSSTGGCLWGALRSCFSVKPNHSKTIEQPFVSESQEIRSSENNNNQNNHKTSHKNIPLTTTTTTKSLDNTEILNLSNNNETPVHRRYLTEPIISVKNNRRAKIEVNQLAELQSGLLHLAELESEYNNVDTSLLTKEQKRKAYRQKTPMSSISSSISSPSLSSPVNNLTFGVPISVMICEDHTPIFLITVLKYLYTRQSYLEEGILRIGGSVEKVQGLKSICDKSSGDVSFLLEELNPHNITSLLKQWLREMPEPLIPPNIFMGFVSAIKIEDLSDREIKFSELITMMPNSNKNCLSHILRFAVLVIQHSETNRMTVTAVGSVLAPTLMRTLNESDFVRYFGVAGSCLMFMLKHFEQIFGVYVPMDFMKDAITQSETILQPITTTTQSKPSNENNQLHSEQKNENNRLEAENNLF